MPPAVRFKIGALGDLHRQLLYAPAAARRRHMDAAERLAAEIDPGRIYPQEYVIYRITGYRPETLAPPLALVGDALLGDLSALVARLSESLDVAWDEAGRRALPLAEVARRLTVSRKTVHRYRWRGLVCHVAVFPDGGRRLACFEDALARFAAHHRRRLERAAAFSRLDRQVMPVIVRAAEREHSAGRLSRYAAARRLAPRYGRSPETVRALLVRHDRGSAQPIFDERGALGARDARLIHRAARLGMTAPRLARRLGKSLPTIHRAINRRRRELLAGLDLRVAPAALPEALLEDPAVVRDLVAPEPRLDALELAAAARTAGPPPALEHALAAGHDALRRRAAAAIAALRPYPASAALDAVETDLRWATLLKRRLVGLGLPAAVRAVEQFLGRPLVHQPSHELRVHLKRAIAVTSAVVDRLDPARQRLDRAVGFAMSRALAASEPPAAGRAGTRHDAGSVILERPFETLSPWQPWLDLRPDLRARLGLLAPRERALLAARYGLAGERPLTLAEIAARRGGTPAAAARLVAGAEAALRGAGEALGATSVRAGESRK